ncbi:AN1-like zinc finger, putative [Leishmania tarentolae]|uniref:AN1-like zinc finger, putative n=1 Tax=Leishmania tarentolae TaxID=5689 RepID=A0A640KL31_LEITA|nr:AN1-like zinc finger, putative [Leishmania tarentolae]
MSERCSFNGCSSMALVVLPKCEHCEQRYCTSHMLPERHGCGDACKNAAQRQATADAAAQRRARRHLGNEDAKKRLDKKLEANEAARRKKTKVTPPTAKKTT